MLNQSRWDATNKKFRTECEIFFFKSLTISFRRRDMHSRLLQASNERRADRLMMILTSIRNKKNYIFQKVTFWVISVCTAVWLLSAKFNCIVSLYNDTIKIINWILLLPCIFNSFTIFLQCELTLWVFFIYIAVLHTF